MTKLLCRYIKKLWNLINLQYSAAVTIWQPFFKFFLALSTLSNDIACTDAFCFPIPALASRLPELTFCLLM
ncbi:hypothetical protein P3S67_007751 [Capsicum chacoense]